MADNIRIELDIETGKAEQKLEEVEAAAKEAGEAVDKLDGLGVDLDGATTAVNELDDVTAAAKTADDQTVDVTVSTSGADTAATSLRNVADSGGAAKSVFANLTGNAAQDLGAIAGVGGSAGVALGQLTERATEGGIALSQMGAATASLAGVAIALEYAKGGLEAIKQADAWDTKKIEDYRDAILEGVAAVDALETSLTEAKGVSVSEINEGWLAGGLPWGDDTVIKDITQDVVDLGLNVETFSQLAAGSNENIDAWGQAQKDAGADSQQLQTVLLALGQEHIRLTKAQDAAKVSQQFLKTEMGDTGKLGANSAAVRVLTANYQALQRAMAAAANTPAPAAAPAAPAAQPTGSMGTRTPSVTTINNYHPSSPTPTQVRLAEQEYQRVNGPT